MRGCAARRDQRGAQPHAGGRAALQAVQGFQQRLEGSRCKRCGCTLALMALAVSYTHLKGGAGLSRQQIADQLDKLQAEVNFGSNGQALTAHITTRRQHLPAVIALVGRLLREPAFPAEPLEELRRQWLTGIERQRKEPEAVISNWLARHGNPYPRGDLRLSLIHI